MAQGQYFVQRRQGVMGHLNPVLLTQKVKQKSVLFCIFCFKANLVAVEADRPIKMEIKVLDLPFE